MTYAAGVACALALSACTGGGSDPGPIASTPPPSTSASAPSPTGSAAPSAPSSSTPITSASGPNFPKGVPAAAQKRSREGAKAFAAHLFEQLNIAWTTPDPQALVPLCDAGDSGTCRAYIKTAQDLKTKREKYSGNPVTATSFLPVTGDEGSKQEIFVALKQEKRSVLNSSGGVVLTDQEKNLHVFVSMTWGATGWKVTDIKKTKS